MKIFLVLFIALLTSSFTYEQQLDERREKIATQIFDQIKCVVCQGQSVASSDVEHARSMRKLVRDKILEGKSEAEILDYVAEIYGDQILLKPPVNQNTIVLWLLPFIFILLGGGIILKIFKR
jgi:cytochrome c-type biogenesis protein CcmH